MRVVLSVHTLPHTLQSIWLERKKKIYFIFLDGLKIYTLLKIRFKGLYFNNSNLTDLFNRKYDENEIRNI